MNSKKDKVKNQRYFQEGWLNDPVFKDRLRKDSKDKAKARTAVYHKTFELSSSGRSAITWKRKETSSKLEEDKQFLLASKKKKKKMSQILPHKSVLWRLLKCHLPQQVNRHWTLVLIYQNVVKAEVIWTMKIEDYCFSFRSSNNHSDLFSTLLPDSAVARGFQKGKTKTMYEITHGPAPYFKSILFDAVDRSDVYTYSPANPDVF